jgi:hypothetical protein
MPASQFWGRVAMRLGADDAAARLVTDAAFARRSSRCQPGDFAAED